MSNELLGEGLLAQLRWFVVHTHAGKEMMANEGLVRHGFATLYPYYLATVKHARYVREVKKPYFPRYLFMGMGDEQAMYRVNETPGVATVLYLGEEPLQLPKAVMKTMFAKCAPDGQVDAPKEQPETYSYQKGQRVRIIDGPLQGLEATVVIDNKGSVGLEVDKFRGAFPISVPARDLKLVHPFCGARSKKGRAA